jgi:hypothetical protein
MTGANHTVSPDKFLIDAWSAYAKKQVFLLCRHGRAFRFPGQAAKIPINRCVEYHLEIPYVKQSTLIVADQWYCIIISAQVASVR